VLAPVALLTAGSSEQQREWLPRIAAGKTRIGVAVAEPAGARGAASVRLARSRLRGRAPFALDAGAADLFLVATGRALLLVARDAPGLSIGPCPTVDVTRRVADLVFEGVAPLDALGGPRAAAAATARLRHAARVALAADLLGAAERMHERAVAYARERRQFGRPIGSFQAVKHMCAEMAAELEPSRALVWYAAHAFDRLPEEARLAATLAKAHLAEVGTRVARTATEVHGGIGFTDEHDLHLWFKRIGLDRQLFGGPAELRAAAARLLGWHGAPATGPEDVESALL
jgi:alkylation response protein AidB-like acyl-CoA dehydrogenase